MSTAFDELEDWGASAEDQRPQECEDGAPELAADLVSGEGLRSLSRETGVNRSAIRRLIDGEGCSLRNLVALTEARPSLVVYVDGVAYRLSRAEDVEFAPELVDALEKEGRKGAGSALGPEKEVTTGALTTCGSCGADIDRGQTSYVTPLSIPGEGLVSRRECQSCHDGQTASAGSGAWRSAMVTDRGRA